MLGSASTRPPTNGGFCQYLAIGAEQCFPIGPEIDDEIAAMMEPFAVALHAAHRAGSLAGKQVLVTGGGPIGLLAVIVARTYGAATVALSDPVENRRAMAVRRSGPMPRSIRRQPPLPAKWPALTGDGFDVMFEASGAGRPCGRRSRSSAAAARWCRSARLRQAEIPLPVNQLMVREIQFVGSFRYGNVFEEGVRLLAAGRVDLRPLVSNVFSLAQPRRRWMAACQRDRVVKVQIDLN